MGHGLSTTPRTKNVRTARGTLHTVASTLVSDEPGLTAYFLHFLDQGHSFRLPLRPARNIQLESAIETKIGRDNWHLTIVHQESALDLPTVDLSKENQYRRCGKLKRLRVLILVPDIISTIAKWLDAPNFDPIYRANLEQHMAKTCQWFLNSDEFQRLLGTRGTCVWGIGMRAPSYSGISTLKLTGNSLLAGAGKSVLS